MKAIRPLSLAIALSSLLGTAAFAQQVAPGASGLSRAQVTAEFERARKAGELITENGLTEAEQDPQRFPQKAQEPALTRGQVIAEYQRAREAGELPTESGLTEAEENPSRYPMPSTKGLTRAQVITEFQRARRDGDLYLEDGETMAQENPSFYADQRVRDGQSRYSVN